MLLLSFLLFLPGSPMFGHQMWAVFGKPGRPDGATGCKDQGDAVFLTPLIKEGRMDKAKKLSKVGHIGADVEVPGYAGFITVNERFNSNLFFWFVPSLRDPKNAPVVLWMQGGPGTSSLMGFFSEHGPYVMSPDGKKAEWRKLTWAQRYSMLYVDQPVGTGFSFTESNEGYARNMADVGRDMLEFVQQFFTLFRELAKNDLYLAGESYAGKYVPTVGAALLESANNARVKVNFRGIAFGNGFTDPVNMLDFGEFIHSIGLMRRADADKMTALGKAAAGLIRDGRSADASFLMDRTIFGLSTKDTFFKNVTGYDYYYNYLIDKEPRSMKSYVGFVTRPEIRRAIHVGHLEFHTSRTVVAEYLTEDIMRSAVRQFTVILEKGYKVLVYSGNLDICVPTTQTERFLSKLEWSHADRWERTPQHIWWSANGQSPLGYKKTIDNLNFMAIRNGGHVLPFDQPEVMFDLITAFIDDTAPFGR